MADSDEYYDDSFELDEAALASIQATEERFGASLSQAPQSRSQPPLRSPPPRSPQPPPTPPPPKRLKTVHQWIEPPAGHERARVPVQTALRGAESVDDNPDIFVGADGGYVLNARSVSRNVDAGGSRGSIGHVVPLTTRGLQQPDESNRVNGVGQSLSISNMSSGVPQVQALIAAPRLPLQRSSSSSHPNRNQRQMSAVPPPFLQSQSQSQSQSQPPSQPRPPQTAPQKRNLIRRAQTPGVLRPPDGPVPPASQARTRAIEQALAQASAESQAAEPHNAGVSSSIQPSDSSKHRNREPSLTPAHESGPSLEAEMAALRAQLAEMNAANAAAQRSLREAQDEQFAKAGEVSNLRRTIDKTTREHAEAMAKAKADIQAAEKVKAELQVKLKEEAERMATQLVFKQHEMETSTRKPTWGSARSRRVAKDLPPPGSATPTRTYAPPSTSRIRLEAADPSEEGIQLSSPISVRKSSSRRSEEVKQPAFKGFQNAFMDSGPVVARSPKKGKREKGQEEDEGDLFFGPRVVEQGQEMEQRSPLKRDKGKGKEVDKAFGESRGEWSSVGGGEAERMMDVDSEAGGAEAALVGGGVPMEVDMQDEEELMVEEGIDWGEELRRIVFTHTAPRTDSLTLHALLSTPLPPETVPKKKKAYMEACQIILETCGAKHGHVHYPEDSEWEADVVDKLASAFVTIGYLLSDTGCIIPLTALLDLLALLTLYIPAFLSPFLGPAASNDVLGTELDPDGPSQLLDVLCDIVRDHITPSLRKEEASNWEDKDKARASLVMAVVQLMETMCWNVKEGLVEQLSSIPRRPQVLETLLHPAQPPALIVRTLRLLILLATHKPIFRSILSYPEAEAFEQPSAPSPDKDWSRIPIIERLCHHLVNPPAVESHTVRRLIVTFITLISNISADALTILLDSVSLAPSIVVCITKLSRLIWEDDLDLLDSPESTKMTTETLYLSVNLLHHLVFAPDSSADLGRKLIDATRLPGPFNGVTHMFIVTFGRLSWAAAPDWLSDDCKDTCEIIADLAVEVIETVVAGPECDSLWAVWHQDEEVDEEEAEARMIEMD